MKNFEGLGLGNRITKRVAVGLAVVGLAACADDGGVRLSESSRAVVLSDQQSQSSTYEVPGGVTKSELESLSPVVRKVTSKLKTGDANHDVEVIVDEACDIYGDLNDRQYPEARQASAVILSWLGQQYETAIKEGAHGEPTMYGQARLECPKDVPPLHSGG